MLESDDDDYCETMPLWDVLGRAAMSDNNDGEAFQPSKPPSDPDAIDSTKDAAMSDDDGEASQPSTAPTDPDAIDSTKLKPVPSLVIPLKVDRDKFYYFQTMTFKEFKKLRPCDKVYSKGHQNEAYEAMKKALSPDTVIAEDESTVTLRTQYDQHEYGFPGRLRSHQVQCLPGCIRAHLLVGTEKLKTKAPMNLLMGLYELSMNMPMHTILKALCKENEISAPMLDDFLENHGGSSGRLQQLMDDLGVTKVKAMEEYKNIWVSCKQTHVRHAHLRECDKEAKKVQQALMAVPELLPELHNVLSCGEAENRPGHFVELAFQAIEASLLEAVRSKLVEAGLEVAALHFDSLNLRLGDLNGPNVDFDITAMASSACETVWPGINMRWEWKELDFNMKSLDTRKVLKKVRVPEDYRAPPLQGTDENDDEDGDGDGGRTDVTLDPETEPTYEEMRAEFSLNLGLDPAIGHGKVGSDFIEVGEDGKLALFDSARFKTRFAHKKYFEIEEVKGEGGTTEMKKTSKNFIERWMQDERMDPRYLKADQQHQRYYWKRFDMVPDISKCPASVYNLWTDFAAASMQTDLADEAVRAGLLCLLKHFKMLCTGDKATYDFLLDILSHAVQYPTKKLGIMLCLVGKFGCGKSTVWEIIQRLIGSEPQTFTTDEPQKDVWGDNNGRMKTAFFVRVAEVAKSAFDGMIGKMRSKITDSPIRVRELYCAAANVANYSRFFLDTNYRNAIPDEHGERRFFIIDCNEEKIGDKAYWLALHAAMADDRVIRALFEFLMARKIKPMYFGKDIPIGDYQMALKDSRRSVWEHFLQWLVEDQCLSKTVLELDANDLYKKFKSWSEDGNEWVRNKTHLMRELKLQSIPGIKQTKKQKTFESAEGHTVRKETRVYVFDLAVLRTHYQVGVPDAAPPPQAAVNCAKDIAEWLEITAEEMERIDERDAGRKRSQAAVDSDMSDDEDDDRIIGDQRRA